MKRRALLTGLGFLFASASPAQSRRRRESRNVLDDLLERADSCTLKHFPDLGSMVVQIEIGGLYWENLTFEIHGWRGAVDFPLMSAASAVFAPTFERVLWLSKGHPIDL